ncbi:hypothetical protein cypCar_00027265 [Cyprinus carpio]|nr:hypothetical protein cypCar_00027265 [Cyprinus carpio]
MMLYCVPKLRLMGQKFSVRERIDIAGMEVQENAKQNVPHTFTISGKQRSLELQARSAEEKDDWIKVILATIEKHKQNSETFKAFNVSCSRDEEHTPDTPKSSKKREKERETCKGCSEAFHFTKRKHHCKSCGAAVCGKCSKVSESRNIRVCKPCFEVLQGAEGTAGGGTEPKRKLEMRDPVLTSERLSAAGDTWDNVCLCRLEVSSGESKPIAVPPEMPESAVTSSENSEASLSLTCKGWSTQIYEYTPKSTLVQESTPKSAPVPPKMAASDADPPEVAGVFTSAPLKTGVSIYKLFIYPEEVMETVTESLVIPVSAQEVYHELLALPITVTKTASEFTQCPVAVGETIAELSACPVMVKETAAELFACFIVAIKAVTNLSVFLIAVLPETLGGSTALSAPLVFSSTLTAWQSSGPALASWSTSVSRPSSTTRAWPAIPPPVLKAGVMSQPSAGMPLPAIRGHSSGLLFVFRISVPITPCPHY